MGGTREIALLPEDNIAYKSFHAPLVLDLRRLQPERGMSSGLDVKIGACTPLLTH